MRRCVQCCLDPPIARVLGRSIPRCTRNQGARARGHGPMDHYVLRTSWNRYPRLFEADRLLILWLQTVLWCRNGPVSSKLMCTLPTSYRNLTVAVCHGYAHKYRYYESSCASYKNICNSVEQCRTVWNSENSVACFNCTARQIADGVSMLNGLQPRNSSRANP